MFNRRPQSWTPLNGGDLRSPPNTWGGDYLQPEDSASSWYPKPSPTYEGGLKGDYELSTISRPPAITTKSDLGIEGDETSLLSAKRHDDYRLKETRFGRMRRKYSGWRTGLTMSASCTGTVFLLNVILTVWATSKFGSAGGYGTLIDGECSKTKKASTWIHLAINVLSTLLLSASNYCMQILTAPTRPEIDRAHAKGKWLDIGVPSMRNLRWISWIRVCLWIVLALSSLPLHLLYNSAVYDTLTANEYFVYGASQNVSSWDNITAYSTPDATVEPLLLLAQQNQLERLDRRACIQAYGHDFVADRRHVILIFNLTNRADDEVFQLDRSVPTSEPTGWICSNLRGALDGRPCDVNLALAEVDNWTYFASGTFNSPIDHCLSERTPESCQLQFSVIIMIIVIIANLLKLLCMVYTVRSHKIPTIVTVGDAISSFLQNPDPTTVDRCTFSKRSVDKDDKWYKYVFDHHNVSYQPVPPEPQPWDGKRYRWFNGASKTRWGFCYVCCFITLLIGGILEAQGEDGLSRSGYPTDIKSLWRLGFGAVTSISLVSIEGLSVITNTLLANAAQVVLSFLYLSYNSIFTCELLSREWTSYASKRKALRVTSPTGRQRSTYFLQLPYTYSIPLLTFSGILHWLVSQSIFLARVNAYYSDGQLDNSESISRCGYSCIAIICVLTVGSVLITAGFLNGFRKYPGGIPLAATCSAAISAACHPPADDVDAAFKEVQYGEVEVKHGVRHCTFTSQPVTTPIAGELYT